MQWSKTVLSVVAKSGAISDVGVGLIALNHLQLVELRPPEGKLMVNFCVA